jgi:ATP-dependent protease HslVU (ClpYQ) ATPase subunit
MSAEERVLDALVGATASPATRDSFRKKLRAGELDDKEIEVEVADTGSPGMPAFEIPGMPGANIGVLNLSEMFGKATGRPHQEGPYHRQEILWRADPRRIRQADRQRGHPARGGPLRRK